MLNAEEWSNRDLQSIIRSRLELLNLHERCPELRAATMQACAADIGFWIDNWVWTYDPRRIDNGGPAIVPFVLFPRQREYLQWRAERRANNESGLIEKSRDMGLSWLNVAAHTHAFLFEPGYKGLIASRKEVLVDSLSNLGALFPKIRFILDSLPQWMRPDYDDRYMRLVGSNGAAVTGEAGEQIGRGDRATVVDLDEAAFLPNFDKIDAAISQTARTVFYTSTPNGTNGFYRKRHSGIPVFTFRWHDHPDKDQAWYDSMKAKLDPIIVAQEIDIAYDASQENSFIPSAWVRAAVGFSAPSEGRKQAGLDVATEGKNRNALTIITGQTVLSIQQWTGLNTTQTAAHARQLLIDQRIPHLNFDTDGVGAGVAGALKSMPNPIITWEAIHGAASASEYFWLDQNLKSKDRFANLRAEMWFNLRERFRKTYEMVEGIAVYDPTELISIPDHGDLIQQLSAPKIIYSNNGKILVESKDAMLKRGIQSPDYADSLVYAFWVPIKMQFAKTRARW